MVGGTSAVIALKNNLYKAYACELSFQIIIWFINLAWHGSFHSYSRVKISHFFNMNIIVYLDIVHCQYKKCIHSAHTQDLLLTMHLLCS